MVQFDGSCHCGAICVTFETEIAPEALEVRACQCSFCRKHASRAVSDPNGYVTIAFEDESKVNRYRFGHAAADYLMCRICGVYLAAVTNSGQDARAVVVVNTLDKATAFTAIAKPVSFDGETLQDRNARRRQRWTPAVIRVGPFMT